ncbi:MAG: 50S ribosomal protein L19e [Candidatus Helarchaeota archaeon]
MKVDVQRSLAARILKVGQNRVWLDPERIEDISIAITRNDIKNLIHEGAIKKRYDRGVSRVRAREIAEKKKRGKRKGEGSRKGKATTYLPRKKAWMLRIRAIRKELKKLRDTKKISVNSYRKLYRYANGGTFRSIAHLQRYIKENKLMRR